MDKNFDERLSKLENILAGIERFMNGYKYPINNNSDDTDIKENCESEKIENAEMNSDQNTSNEINTENKVELTKTESNTNEISTNFSEESHGEIQPVKNNIASSETNIDTIALNTTKQSTCDVKVINKIDINNTSNNNEKNVDINDVNEIDKEKVSIENAVKHINYKLVSENQYNDRTKPLENESADGKDSINDTVNYAELNKRLISIEVLLKEISISIQNLKPKGYYRNWEAKHQVILSFSFVPKDVFTKVLWKMSRQIENFYTGESSVNRLFDSLPTFQVSRSTRFPPNGVYVDLNDYDIYNQCQRIREAAFYCGPKGKTLSKDVFKTSLAYLHNLVVCDVNDPKVAGMMYDLQGFEKNYGLEWYEEY